MLLFENKSEDGLSEDEKASAINLAFLLDVTNYDKNLIEEISKRLTTKEKQKIYKFWAQLTPVTSRAYLCMAEFEGRI